MFASRIHFVYIHSIFSFIKKKKKILSGNPSRQRII